VIDHVDMRCKNWARWLYTGGGGPAPVRSWWGPLVLDPHMGDPGGPNEMPVDDDEAKTMHDAIESLPQRLRTVLAEHYLKQGSTREQKAKRAGCAVRTFYDRVQSAHVMLDRFYLRQAVAKPHTHRG
jgi:DNA-directed RNA polymerase specialized sigma24 family protein